MDPAYQYSGSGPDAPGWALFPAEPYGPASPAPAAPRARMGAILLTALLTELVLIGFGANQWVSDKILRDNPSGITRRLIDASWLTYTWRFSPRTGLTRLWWSQILLVLTVLVLSAALIWCLLRGAVTFGRAFFGTWLAVVFATLVGGFVRGLLDPFGKASMPGTDRVTRAVFGPYGPGQTLVFGSVALGLVVALIVAVVAVATRRRPAAAGAWAAAPGEAGPSAFADYGPPLPSAPAAAPPWQDQHFGPPPGPPPGPALRKDEPTAATTQLPRLPEDDRPTTAAPPATEAMPVPAWERAPERPEAPEGPTTQQPGPEGGDQAAGRPQAQGGDQPTTQLPAEQSTTRFPRPPDDEELGHIDH